MKFEMQRILYGEAVGRVFWQHGIWSGATIILGDGDISSILDVLSSCRTLQKKKNSKFF